MFRRTNRSGPGRPSPAMVVACLSLFVALSGVGYAAATIGSSQIKNNSVQGKDIKNKTIKAGDIAVATRNSLKGQTGPAGTAGAKGAAGTPGAPGGTGLTGPRGPSDARIKSDDNINVTACAGPLSACTSLLSLPLTAGSWVITAKFLLDNNAAVSNTSNECGILNTFNSTIDSVRIPSLGGTGTAGEAEVVTLTGTITTPGFASTVGIRCSTGANTLAIEDADITAIQVATVTVVP